MCEAKKRTTIVSHRKRRKPSIFVMQQWDASTAPQAIGFSSIWQLPVQTALDAQYSTLWFVRINNITTKTVCQIVRRKGKKKFLKKMKFPLAFLKICGIIIFVAKQKNRLGYRQAVRQQILNLPFRWFESIYPSQKAIRKSGLLLFFASGFDRSGVRKQSSGLFSLRPAFAAAKANPSIRAKKQFAKVDCFYFLQMDSIGAVKGNCSLSISFIIKAGRNFYQNN